VQTRRLAESFEGLNSSLAQSAQELWHQGNQKPLLLGQIPGTNISYTGSQGVKQSNYECTTPFTWKHTYIL